MLRSYNCKTIEQKKSNLTVMYWVRTVSVVSCKTTALLVGLKFFSWFLLVKERLICPLFLFFLSLNTIGLLRIIYLNAQTLYVNYKFVFVLQNIKNLDLK